MALDFTNASLLGYNVINEFLGEAGKNHRKIIALNIEGFIDDGQRADKLEQRALPDGVSENYAKIREQIANGDDYWDSNIVVNGKNFGRGRVLSLDFPSAVGTPTNQIRFGKYTAALELYRKGDFDDFIGAPYLGGDQQFVQYINTITETLALKKEEDGSISADLNFSISLMSGDYGDTASDPITVAKSVFAGTQGGNWQGVSTTNVIDAFDNTIMLGGIASNYSEEYDLINYSFSFSKSWKSLPEGNVPNTSSNTPSNTYDFSAQTSRTIQASDGVITVAEKGNIESFAGDWFDMTGGMQVGINTSYVRCSTLFGDIVNDPSENHHYPLNSSPISISRQYDSGAGVGSYSISYNNKSGVGAYFTHEYTQSISRDAAGLSQVTEQGAITTRQWKGPAWAISVMPVQTPLAYYRDRVVDSYFHAKEFYQNFKGRFSESPLLINSVSENISFPQYGKAINYSITYSDDPTIYPDGHASYLKQAQTTVSDTAPMPIVKPYTIPHRGAKGEVIHEPGQTAPGARSISVSAVKARQCYYSNLTGNAENVLPNWTAANNWVLHNIIRPEAELLSLPKINAIVLDMYVNGMASSMASDGSISMSVDLVYTAGKYQPQTFNSNSSNYNV